MRPSAIRIALFGHPSVADAAGAREYPLPRKTLNVLAYLILNKRAPTRDAAASALFPDEDEDQARNSLRRNLSYLLSSLPPIAGGEPFVHTDGDRLAWNVAAAADVDVIAFELAIAEERDDDALALYAGPLLPTLYDEWTLPHRERLREVANAALARTITRDRSMRRFDTATAAARRLLEDDPWREDIVRQLMAIRYEAGDRAGAFAAFAQFSSRLRDEMAAEPMPETSALREAMLRGARLATSEPAPRERSAIAAALPFVGRDDALARAVERWHTSADGGGGALFVAGEAGIGKSRFVSELARAIEREGGMVVVGETTAGGERYPYEAVIEALRYAPATPAGATARRSDEWRKMVEQLLDEHSHATIGDDRSARVRLFGTIVKALRELARARPLAIVLEDLHWAGAATIELIAYVAERLATAAFLIIGTYRDDELPRSHPLRLLVRDAERAGRATFLPLRRLTIRDAVAAARAAIPAGFTDDAVATAAEWSEGVPLLLAEAARDLAAGRAFNGGNFTSVMGDRFARLPPEADTALTYGAVLGARFELDVLAAATGWRDDELIDALAPAMELGLIRSGPRGRGLTFAFSHHVIHAAMLARVPESELISTHALVARALATMHGGRERALEIAHHFAAAGDALRAAEHYAAGARYALDVFANIDARDAATAGLVWTTNADDQREIRYELVFIRERALARLTARTERRGDAELLCELAGGDELRMCDALERLIEALRGEEESQRAAFARLEQLASGSVFAAATFEKASATEATARGDFRTAASAAARAAGHFELLEDRDAALRARLRGVNAMVCLGEHAAAAEVIAAIRCVAEVSDDLPLRMEFYLAAAFPGGEHTPQSLADAERSLDLALQIGDRYGEAQARHQVAHCAGALGETARAMAEYDRAIKVYADVGNMRDASLSLLNLASSRGWLGDYNTAFRLLDEVEALELNQPYITFQLEAHRGSLALRAGDIDRAERPLLAAQQIARDLGYAAMSAHCAMYLAEVAARRNRLDEALVGFAAARTALHDLGFPGAVAELQSLVARVCAELHDEPAARAAIAEAESIAQALPPETVPTNLWWNLAAACALLGGAANDAERFAQIAARTFGDNALELSPEDAESYSRLPWHIDTFALLAGREVSLRLAGRANGVILR